MPYKLYTESNLKRKWIPFNEFKDQYRNEHIDDKTSAELEQDYSPMLDQLSHMMKPHMKLT